MQPRSKRRGVPGKVEPSMLARAAVHLSQTGTSLRLAPGTPAR
jgi:hypothetical protein